MYRIIKEHPNPREIYINSLVQRDLVERKMAETMESVYWEDLQNHLNEIKEKPLPYTYQEPEEAWRALKKHTLAEDYEVSPETGVDKALLEEILTKLREIPDGFTPLGKIKRLIKGMEKSVREDKLEWSLAELTGYGTLLLEGFDVRLSGQDAKRGTFSHRHAVLYDDENYVEHNRLSGLSESQGRYFIYNSLLSEFGVLGFEYGYSMATPHTLCIWEAQFGDFSNGAQTIIDQFVMAGESKWQRMNGLVMLLPHGYEGQGPEHSSARMERFLQGCAENNVSVVNISTPANFFHALRRQMHRPFRKPLVVMSPKSLLRHPLCVSALADFDKGTRFHEVLDDPNFQAETKPEVRKVLFCSGKVYYDLFEAREAAGIQDVAICRIEQIYPFPIKQVQQFLKKYKTENIYWVQEEPLNMGAWGFLRTRIPEINFKLISRKAAASPATGYNKVHHAQQKAIIDEALS
jgi:2-oxoglutarate dehydrogenase E1 component